MTLSDVGLYATTAALLIGATFSFVGALGLLRLTGSMNRLHAPTKVGTIGVGAFLVGSMIYAYTSGYGSFHEVLIMAFLFVTAPISANFMAKVHIHRQSCETPPAPVGGDDQWATQKRPDDDPV